jgi:hypothetical protein
MDRLKVTILMFTIHYLEYNLIDSKGCQFLSQANWPCLSVLKLNNNRISSEGVKHLSKAQWPLLKIFKLCTFSMFREQSNRKLGLF